MDNDGNIVNQISYDAFGNITVESNPDVNFRFGYTGRELDPETGLYNYRSRYYDPAVGEFVSEDAIGFAGGDSNLYRYVNNDPLNRIDPFGFCGVALSFDGSNQSETLVAGGIFDESGGGIDLGDVVKGIVGGIGAAIGAIFSILSNDSESQDPNQTTKGEPGAFDPNEINFGTYKPEVDPFNVETFPRNADPNDFLNGDNYTFPDGENTNIRDYVETFPKGDNDLAIDRFETYYNPLSPNRLDPANLDFDDLLNKANEPHKNTSNNPDQSQTKANRALDKHARDQRGNSPFPPLKGNNASKNKQASDIVEDILTAPDAVFVQIGTSGVEVRVPDQRGIRYNQDGSFAGFVD